VSDRYTLHPVADVGAVADGFGLRAALTDGTLTCHYAGPEPWRRRPESNRCTGLCRPLPKPLGHAAQRVQCNAGWVRLGRAEH
jgi:hypothetical protein